MEITEIPIQPGNRLVGMRIRNSQIREQTGANIIGAWIDGELQLPPDPDAVIRSNTVLLVSGAHDELEAFGEFTQPYPYRTFRRHERIIIAGQGEVGQAARGVIAQEGLDVTTIDIEDHDGVDIVGDADSDENLQAADIGAAGAIIVGLPDDSASLLTTVLARSLNSNIEILARVSDINATRKARSAGADYVLPVPRVSAWMVVSELHDEDILAPASQIRLLRVPADPLAGSTLAESDIYERAGCRVIAVEDDSGLTSTVDPQRRFTGEERIVLVGSDEAVQQFRKQFDVSPIEPEA
ncbi:MAG: K+ transport system, NAD-binding component [Haloquadratum walsbyi J07HQW1]|jgi:K+ transport systems, NAD-binding component|uniref:K+ transport system, NAD-binding component n=1 Tax=Haloquadratum walsbyi J07HQW1 TaxID=1238424 RepID=U1PEV9_9EURY|nr:MAG: K+ transport system, NAD-binding component [Haloquadratum walsbyi J07HQW1]